MALSVNEMMHVTKALEMFVGREVTGFTACFDNGMHQLVLHAPADSDHIGTKFVTCEGYMDYTEEAKLLNELLGLEGK